MIQDVKSLGYEAESHVIESFDGYLLRIFRIPANKNGIKGKQPIFLQHGFLASCTDWLDLEQDSLAVLLIEEGYDVWIGNARGNIYCRKHVALSEKDRKFWDFSFHEMGLYDIPAVLKYIQKHTEFEKDVLYVGFSMGTTMFFVFSSLLPNIAQGFKAMVALAPVAFMKHVKNPIRLIAPFSTEVEFLSKAFGVKQVFPKSALYKFLCTNSKMMNLNIKFCEQLMAVFGGYNKQEYDDDILHTILTNKPAGTSTKTLFHYTQIIKNNGIFSFYDYGVHENEKKYGMKAPPPYIVENIKVPTLLVYGPNDTVATPQDVEFLTKKLTNSFEVYEVPYERYGHVDFMWSKNAIDLVYKPILKYLQKFPIK